MGSRVVQGFVRLIHVMGAFGRSCCQASLRRGPSLRWGYFEFGGLLGRCRESTTVVQEVAGWRLRSAGLAHCTTYFDTSHTFPSTISQALKTTMKQMALRADRELHYKRTDNGAVTSRVEDTEMTMVPGSGELQRDHAAPIGAPGSRRSRCLLRTGAVVVYYQAR